MSSHWSWNMIKHFSGSNMSGFAFQDVARAFQVKSRVHLARILAEMVNMGMLCKITRGHYHIIPFNADPNRIKMMAHQVAKYLMQPKEYDIGYASAVKIHGLMLQSALR